MALQEKVHWKQEGLEAGEQDPLKGKEQDFQFRMLIKKVRREYSVTYLPLTYEETCTYAI